MKSALLLLSLLLIVVAEPITFHTLSAPVIRESNSLDIQIQHRFKRAFGDEKSATIAGGAGVNYRVNYLFLRRVMAEIGYTSNETEFAGGFSYHYPFLQENLNVTAGVTFFSMETENDPARNFRYHAALSSHLINGRVVPTITVVYNGYYEAFTGMAGVIGSPLDFLHIIAEMGFTNRQIDLYKENTTVPFSAGIAFSTYAHQFDLYVTNSTQTGIARALMGGEKKVYLGFRITRLFTFGESRMK